MAKVQVVGVSDLEGIGKESQKAYFMRNVKVVATDDQGVCEVGELTFFKRDGQPLPEPKLGKVYTPVVSFVSEKGKLAMRITDLAEVKQ